MSRWRIWDFILFCHRWFLLNFNMLLLFLLCEAPILYLTKRVKMLLYFSCQLLVVNISITTTLWRDFKSPWWSYKSFCRSGWCNRSCFYISAYFPLFYVDARIVNSSCTWLKKRVLWSIRHCSPGRTAKTRHLGQHFLWLKLFHHIWYFFFRLVFFCLLDK